MDSITAPVAPAGDNGHRLAPLIRLARLVRNDLHDRFADPEGRDSDAFLVWCATEGRKEFPRLAGQIPPAVLMELAECPAGLPDDTVLPVTRLAVAIHRLRGDLARIYDLARAEGRAGFVAWLLLNGLREYDLFAFLPASHLERLAAAVADCGPDVPPLTRLARVVWQTRRDLEDAFDLATAAGRARYVVWYLTQGVEEHGLTPLLTPREAAWLDEPEPSLPDDIGHPVTRRLYHLWHRRPDLQQTFDVATPAGRFGLVAWHLLSGGARTFADAEAAWLGEVLALPIADGPVSLPRWMLAVWCLRPDLQAAFPLGGRADVQRLADWCAAEGRRELPAIAALMGDVARPAGPAVRRTVALERGVNVIGCARGEFGIGEDVRMIARSLAAAGVPVGILDRNVAVQSRMQDRSADDLLIPERRYTVDILAMTPFDTGRMHLGQDGWEDADEHRTGVRHTVGCWPCELAEWPTYAAAFGDLVDEVWASTRFAKAAWEAGLTVPVERLPLAVSVEADGVYSRADYGLPAGDFLFLFIFDVFSGMGRKNPWAVVRAFRKAYAPGQREVGLVIKVMNARDGDPAWEALRAECAEDSRIRIIADTLDRGRLLGLIAACDSLVSLHRAEGFGRTLAEAMLLGKPVVATAYSGNTDFTLADNACLIGYRMVPIAPGVFPLGEGQLWAEADVEHAAWSMARLSGDQGLYRRLAAAGRAHVLANHAPAVVGWRYRRRLETLGLLR